MLVLERLGLPPEEDALRLGFVDIHHRSEALFVVWRNEAVDIAKLYDWTNLLILLDGIATDVFLKVGHVLRLDLHA